LEDRGTSLFSTFTLQSARLRSHYELRRRFDLGHIVSNSVLAEILAMKARLPRLGFEPRLPNDVAALDVTVSSRIALVAPSRVGAAAEHLWVAAHLFL
jgi:hypothetical protein